MPTLDASELAAVFAGGVAGALARAGVVEALPHAAGNWPWALAALAIRYRMDQIIAGTVINLFALGITGFLSARVLEPYQSLNNPGRSSCMI